MNIETSKPAPNGDTLDQLVVEQKLAQEKVKEARLEYEQAREIMKLRETILETTERRRNNLDTRISLWWKCCYPGQTIRRDG